MQPTQKRTLSFDHAALDKCIKATQESVASEYSAHSRRETIRSVIEVATIQFLLFTAITITSGLPLHFLRGWPMGAAITLGLPVAASLAPITTAIHICIRAKTECDNDKRNLSRMHSLGEGLKQGDEAAMKEFYSFSKRTGVDPLVHDMLPEEEMGYVLGAALMEFVREKEGLGEQSSTRAVTPRLPPRQDESPSAPPFPPGASLFP